MDSLTREVVTNGVATSQTFNFDYDLNGSLIKDHRCDYTYDAEHRLKTYSVIVKGDTEGYMLSGSPFHNVRTDPDR